MPRLFDEDNPFYNDEEIDFDDFDDDDFDDDDGEFELGGEG